MKKFQLGRKLKIVLLTIIVLVLIAIPLCYYEVYISYNKLQVNSYNISSKNIDSKVRFVVIGDLHDNVFEENNSELISKIKSQSPDFIVADGDILNGESQSSDIAIDLIEELVKVAPVYYALGNHELEYMEKNGEGLLEEISQTGAILLEKEYKDIVVNNQKIRIGGLYGYAFDTYSGECTRDRMQDGNYDFLREFEDTDSYKIMLSHRPDSFIFGQASRQWYVDLVVSAHNHGGQVVFPFFGGLYGGDQGYFPEYTHGLYKKDMLNIIITSGLGSHTQKLPRFNNVPEIMVVNLD